MYPAADSLRSTFRVASTEAVSYDLSRGLPTGIFDYARFIFVQYVRIALQCKPDVKLSYVILCWINPCLSLSLSLSHGSISAHASSHITTNK